MGYGHECVQDKRIRALEGKLEVLMEITSELLMPNQLAELHRRIRKVDDDIMDEDRDY